MKPRALLTSWACLQLLTTGLGEDFRLGIIGLDTSHVIAFTKILNQEDHKDHVPGARVVAAFKGGSPDVKSSYSRVDGFTNQLREDYGVRIMDSIEKLCENVDGILLESVDGRPHLEQARPVIEKGLPLFIDKPVAGSLKDAIEIYQLAAEANVPVFSSSSYRFYESLQQVKSKDVGEIRSVISYGPCSLEPHHPDLFWYGVHPTEALFTLMGVGCQTVSRVSTKDTDVVTGVWSDGRVGVLHGLRNGKTPHQVTVFGSDGVAVQNGGGSYVPLVQEIVKFFETGKPPVDSAETLEMFTFMEAADESKRRGGAPVAMNDIYTDNGGK
jgi:predicted dehydrogenase